MTAVSGGRGADSSDPMSIASHRTQTDNCARSDDTGHLGAGGRPVTLLLRREIAELQAQYLAYVDGRSLSEQPMGGALWVGVSAMTTLACK